MLNKFLIALFFLSVTATLSNAQTAPSCNNKSGQLDVQNTLNTVPPAGTLTIPSGTCAWTVPLAMPNFGITIQCQGTVIQNNTGGKFLSWTDNSATDIPRITGCDFEPPTTGSSIAFMSWIGTCNSTQCTRFQFDHNLIGAASCYPGNSGGTPMFTIQNTNARMLHNGTLSQPMCATPGGGSAFFDYYMNSFQGVGDFGDNSWVQPDNFGGTNAIYLEDNYFLGGSSGIKTFMSDCDGRACRVVFRFNTVTNANIPWHGTESPGRNRGGKQWEIYGNTFISNCPTGGAYVPTLIRSGTAIIGSNTFKVIGSCSQPFNQIATLNEFRAFGDVHSGFYVFWASCGTCTPYDVNDGQQTVIFGTVTSTTQSTVTDTSKTWTANQFLPTTGGVACLFGDYKSNNSGGPIKGILDNTSSNTISLGGGTLGNGSGLINVGDPYWISCAKAYVAGTSTGGGLSTITDATQNFPSILGASPGTNGAPYTMWDITLGASDEILSYTPTTLTGNPRCDNFSCATFPSGDIYVVTRSTRCADQPGTGILVGHTGVLLSGNPATPPASGGLNEDISPVYEFASTIGPGVTFQAGVNVSSLSGREIVNRDFFQESTGQGANGNCGGVGCTPFNGTSGNGHGLLANRPNCTSGPACLTGAGYWATDQGSWNQAPDNTYQGFGQGQGTFYTWSGSSWGTYWTPATYPIVFSGAPTIGFSPSSLGFGNVTIGTTSTPLTTTVSNTGNATLTWTFISTAAPFAIGGGTCATSGGSLGIGASCTVSVTFSPTAVGAASGNLTIADNSSGAPHTVPLTGTGISPVTSTLTPGSASFSNTVVSQGSATQILTLTNTGGATMAISSIIASAGFAQSNNCGASLGAGISCQITVQFSPVALGTASGSLTVISNSSNSPNVSTLTGTGIASPTTAPGMFAGGRISAAGHAGFKRSETWDVSNEPFIF